MVMVRWRCHHLPKQLQLSCVILLQILTGGTSIYSLVSLVCSSEVCAGVVVQACWHDHMILHVPLAPLRVARLCRLTLLQEGQLLTSVSWAPQYRKCDICMCAGPSSAMLSYTGLNERLVYHGTGPGKDCLVTIIVHQSHCSGRLHTTPGSVP